MIYFYQMTGKSLKNSRPVSSSLDEIQEMLAPLNRAPDATAVFADLDGTLAPIQPRPDSVQVPAHINRLIRKLAHRFLAVTVVSGRPATEAKRIVGVSDLAYIGNHGFETMIPGHAVVVNEEAQPYLPGIRQLADFCKSVMETAETGVWMEDKGVTLSLHFRGASDPAAARESIEAKIMPRIKELGLKASEGRMVIEIKPPVNVNKGSSVGEVLDRLGARQAIYIGDDTTDIDALKELRRRARQKDTVMIGVGVISTEMPSDLAKHSDLLVERSSGVELVLQILAGEEV